MMRFEPGAVITRREVLHGQTWLEHPVTVVADDGEVLAVRVDPGSRFAFADHPFGPHPWSAHSAWSGSTVLQITRRDTWYGVWKFFDAGGEFRNWYLNFEPPVVRARNAVETDDDGLDLVVYPDGRREWKDVEDLHRQHVDGRISADTVLRVLSVASDVVDLLDADERWWSAWDRWSPSD